MQYDNNLSIFRFRALCSTTIFIIVGMMLFGCSGGFGSDSNNAGNFKKPLFKKSDHNTVNQKSSSSVPDTKNIDTCFLLQ